MENEDLWSLVHIRTYYFRLFSVEEGQLQFRFNMFLTHIKPPTRRLFLTSSYYIFKIHFILTSLVHLNIQSCSLFHHPDSTCWMVNVRIVASVLFEHGCTLEFCGSGQFIALKSTRSIRHCRPKPYRHAYPSKFPVVSLYERPLGAVGASLRHDHSHWKLTVRHWLRDWHKVPESNLCRFPHVNVKTLLQ